ncbi:MAG: peptidoglycan editing factor PgeF [Chloroflexota bacterium]|nr:peptidoglycan editing factor PgeF [Chloroflexota bacterium]
MRYEIASNGIPFLQFESIPVERVVHGVFTRHGGVSLEPWAGLNFSITVGDSHENVRQNHVLAHEALGLDPARMMDRHLMHTSRTWHADERHLGMDAPLADAAVTRTPYLSFVMTSADCQTILAYDPVRHVLGVAHAGWRGTLDGIALSLVQAMEVESSRARDLRVALGPAIGHCCYEVGPEVAACAAMWPGGEQWVYVGPRGREMLDLAAANESILRRAGVVHIEHSNLCTACRTDLFYSHRAEPPTTGRFALVAALRS